MRVVVERWEDEAEIAEITALLHAAYASLAALGFRYVEYVDWEVTNYRSVILSKPLVSPAPTDGVASNR